MIIFINENNFFEFWSLNTIGRSKEVHVGYKTNRLRRHHQQASDNSFLILDLKNIFPKSLS